MIINNIHCPRKKLGQNFLINNSIIEKIINIINVTPEDNIVEIGPGLGAITLPILKIVKKLNVIEIDKNIVPLLKKICNNTQKLVITNEDILKVNLTKFYQRTKIKLVGNLPFNISSKILFHIVKFSYILKEAHFLLQKEVTERITAKPNNKKYGRLSVMLQYHFVCKNLCTVEETAFLPIPKVQSALLKLTPIIEPAVTAKNYNLFTILVKNCFNQRRKCLKNSLKNILYKKPTLYSKLPIDINLRPENLSVTDFIKLANYIEESESYCNFK